MYKCEICGRKFEKAQQKGGHVYYCRAKRDGIDLRPGDRFAKGRGWAKGLTKDTHSGLMNMSRRHSGRLKGRTDTPYTTWRKDKEKSRKANLKLSITRKRLFADGKLTVPVASKRGQSSIFIYNSNRYHFRSRYEFVFALFLAHKNIIFNYENVRVEYNSITRICDFEVNGKLYEIKGYHSDKDIIVKNTFTTSGFDVKFVYRPFIKLARKYLHRRGYDIKHLLEQIKQYRDQNRIFEFEFCHSGEIGILA